MASPGDSEEAMLLTLAALTYRGFSDILLGEAHEYVVRRALLNGLEQIEPVRGLWELVWGPATSRLEGDRFDASCMYVVRSRQSAHRYVIAVRGTNPVSLADWTFGDLSVAAKVAWPYGDDGAQISTSTALGLRTLQRLTWSQPPSIARIADSVYQTIRDGVSAAWTTVQQLVRSAETLQSVARQSLEDRIGKVVEGWLADLAAETDLPGLVGELIASRITVKPGELRRRWQPAADRSRGIELLTFLKDQADASPEPLEVIVTGHSKGGALAPALALWLAETRAGGEVAANECWDRTGNAVVRGCAFAGPTPGDAAFAARVDRVLGDRCRQVVNTNDVVTHAWEPKAIEEIPTLYGERSRVLAPLTQQISRDVRDLDYRHPTAAVTSFPGKAPAGRSFSLAQEVLYQHLDAYLRNAKLPSSIDALTFFLA